MPHSNAINLINKGENKIQLSDYIDNGISNLQKNYKSNYPSNSLSLIINSAHSKLVK